MKTTVEITEHLFVRVKKLAAERHVPLRRLIEEGLRRVLSEKASLDRKRGKIQWVTVPGGLPPGLALSDREAMHEWLNDPGTLR
jgi:hypothetical protein